MASAVKVVFGAGAQGGAGGAVVQRGPAGPDGSFPRQRGREVGRVGEVSDIAETFLYLMRNGYSSGTIVTVDGGSVLV